LDYFWTLLAPSSAEYLDGSNAENILSSVSSLQPTSSQANTITTERISTEIQSIMPMYSGRTLDIDDPSPIDPIVRIIEFNEEPVLRTVAFFLRKGWEVKQPEDPLTGNTVGNFIRDFSQRQNFEVLESEQNPDTNTLDTPWRLQITDFWKHLYTNTTQFLWASTPTAGHMKSHGVFPLHYQEAEKDGHGKIDSITHKVFESNVLLVPTFIADGVNLRITRYKTSQDREKTEKELCTFSWTENKNIIVFLRREFEIDFHVEYSNERKVGDVAVVLAMCILTLYQVKEDSEEEEEDEEEEGEGEAQGDTT
jgi:hypothetical protein